MSFLLFVDEIKHRIFDAKDAKKIRESFAKESRQESPAI